MINWTVKDIRDAVNSGTISASAIVEESLNRIAKKDSDIGAFLEVFVDDARTQAKAVDARIKAAREIGKLPI